VGAFYPPDLTPADALTFYARAFDTVEVNATFHAIPADATVHGWDRKTPPGFRFAVKLPRAFTHEARLQLPDCEPLLAAFLRVMRLLGDKLGPLLVQLPPSFDRTPAHRLALASFLDHLLTDEVRTAVELRHPSWADPAVEHALAERNVAWCLAEGGPNSRAVMFPADFTYVRWNRSWHTFENFSEVWLDRSADLDWWADTLRHVPAHVKTIFAYMSNEFAGHAPASLRALQQRLGLHDMDPKSLWLQRTLF
jgi:uncharacterized protein YecE (DUF72 family)